MHTRFVTTSVTIACLLLAGGLALAQPQLPTFQPGDVLRADQLNSIVDQVTRNASAAQASGGGAAHAVDCGAGDTIADAMAQAQPGDTIMLTGTCSENVVVTTDDLTLDGGGSAVIDGAGIDRWGIDVTGRQRVTLKGLTVANAHAIGITITEASGVWMEDVTVRNTRRNAAADVDGTGIFVGNGSSLMLAGAIAANDNTGHGILVWEGGDAALLGNHTPRGRLLPPASLEANRNGENGIFIAASSSLLAISSVAANTTLHAKNNTYGGIGVLQSSSLIVIGADIEATNNGGSGLDVTGAGAAQFWGSSALSKTASGLFDGNGGAGINVSGSSSFGVWDDGVAVNITSTNNSWRGLNVAEGSAVAFYTAAAPSPSRVVFNDNGAEGIDAGQNASFISKIPLEAKDNGAEGVGAWGGGHLDITNGDISDNESYAGVAVITNSSATLNSCRIENNAGLGAEVSNNSTLHIYDTEITGNTGHGIAAYNHGFVQGFQDVGSSITNNGGHGIEAWNGASAQLYNATISGNAGNAINAGFASRFHFVGGSITGAISCDDTSQIAGAFACPE